MTMCTWKAKCGSSSFDGFHEKISKAICEETIFWILKDK